MFKRIALGTLLFAIVMVGAARADDALNQALFDAAKAGDIATVEALIAKGADVDAKLANGNTPLIGAACYGHMDIVKLLIAKGANVNAASSDGWTLLHRLAYLGKKDVTELLITKGANVNAKTVYGQTPLYLTAQYGHKDVAESLIANGADLNVKDNNSWSPLYAAIFYNKEDVAELLISKGADVNAKDNEGEMPLYCAATGGNKVVAELLITKGADVNARENVTWARGRYGWTPLYYAVDARQKEMAAWLIAKGADVNAKTVNGSTALYDAISNNDKEMMELLIAKGADVNAKDTNGSTPLYRAKTREVAELLIAKGADVNANSKYDTLLSMAAQNNLTEIVELLIARGADVNSKSPLNGETPLFAAARLDKAEIAELLIAKGADVNAKDRWGNMPIDAAIGYGREDTIKLLIAAGADLNPNETVHDHKSLLEEVNSAAIKNKVAVTAILQAAMIKKAGNSDTLLQQQLVEFKGHSGNDDLRKSIIDLALKMKPSPAIPAEAEAAAGRGTYIFKNAKTEDDKLSAAKEYLTAIELAPWVANYYYNLCTVLEKTPYTQQALHACKLYLVAAPNAADAGDMRQRIAGLQFAVDRDKSQAKGRTTFVKGGKGESTMNNLYRIGGIFGDVSGNDIAMKIIVNWYAGPPKYQIYIGCFDGNEIYGDTYDLVSTDRWEGKCKSNVNLHLVIRPEGEGFVEVSSTSGGSLRATLDELFKAKQKAMEQAVMSSATGDQGEMHFYVVYLQGGNDNHYAGYAQYESTCNGRLLKQDPRALPDGFVALEMAFTGNFGRFIPEVSGGQPATDLCSRQFSSKTGYHFGKME